MLLFQITPPKAQPKVTPKTAPAAPLASPATTEAAATPAPNRIPDQRASTTEPPPTPGVSTVVDGTLGTGVLPVIQVLFLAALLAGIIYRLTDKAVFWFASRAEADRTAYETELVKTEVVTTDIVQFGLENEALEEEIDILRKSTIRIA